MAFWGYVIVGRKGFQTFLLCIYYINRFKKEAFACIFLRVNEVS